MRTKNDYQAAWSSARSWLGVHQAGAAAELYNSLSAMFRNLAIVLRSAVWLGLIRLALDLCGTGAPLHSLVTSRGTLASLAFPLVVAIALALMSHRRGILADQYETLERLFAKEVVLAFQASPAAARGGAPDANVLSTPPALGAGIKVARNRWDQPREK